MGATGAYAGQPHSFYCSKCRRSPGFTKRMVLNGKHTTVGGYAGGRWKLTGKKRKQLSEGMNYHGWGDTAYQYECLDCGHIGWSRHPIVERRFKREHGDG